MYEVQILAVVAAAIAAAVSAPQQTWAVCVCAGRVYSCLLFLHLASLIMGRFVLRINAQARVIVRDSVMEALSLDMIM